MTPTCTKSHPSLPDLDRFTGTEHWYRHPFMRRVTYTDGAKYVADTAAAYWLLDEIAFAQIDVEIALEDFQVWTLVVNADATATLTCEDGNDRAVNAKALPFTDFPAPGVTLWFAGGVIYLPSEH